jgi:hypothetical protein
MRRTRAVALALALALGLGAPARAGDAPRASASQARAAAAAFEDFARKFMAEVRRREEREKRRPRVAAGPESAVFTYRGYGGEFRTELRPTGQAAAPFVGLLHYTEHVYSCPDLKGGPCRVAASLPVTEIFRYRDGRWVY